MDWNKAKNIILIVLLLTNIFLIAAYGVKNSDNGENSDTDVYRYTMNVLEENNIFYKGAVYEGTLRIHPLTVSYGRYDSKIVSNAIRNTRKLSESERTSENYRNISDDFLEKCGFMSENVKFVSIESDSDSAVITYENYYKNRPVRECFMKVYFKDGSIADFDRKWMEVVSESESKIEVISQLSALLKFMTETESDEKITVDDMYLVYWIDDYDLSGDILYDTALPAWCINYNNGRIKYISATVQ